jgi:hypothetical protein
VRSASSGETPRLLWEDSSYNRRDIAHSLRRRPGGRTPASLEQRWCRSRLRPSATASSGSGVPFVATSGNAFEGWPSAARARRRRRRASCRPLAGAERSTWRRGAREASSGLLHSSQRDLDPGLACLPRNRGVMFRQELVSTDETATRVEEISMRSERRARSPVLALRDTPGTEHTRDPLAAAGAPCESSIMGGARRAARPTRAPGRRAVHS